MAYLQDIQVKIPTNFDSKFTDWMIFLRDHLTLLRSKSTTVELDTYNKRRMKYRPEILIEWYRIPKEQMYIFLMLNYISSPTEMVDFNYIYIPDQELITKMYSDFLLQETGKTIKKPTKIK
jgi:hypothetical protein